jgi:hypothetical protein
MDKAAGKGKIKESLDMRRQSGRGNWFSSGQRGSQGRGRGGRGPPRTPPRGTRRSTRLIDQEGKTREATVEDEGRTTNPYESLRIDEEEESEEEEMEKKIEEMQVGSPKRSPRRPAVKRTEREDASVGSMRRPSNRGKHEEVSLKKTLEATNDATMEEEQEKRRKAAQKSRKKKRKKTWS